MGILRKLKIKKEKEKAELRRAKADSRRASVECKTADYAAKTDAVDAKAYLKERKTVSRLEKTEHVNDQSTRTQSAIRKNNLSTVQTVESTKQMVKGVYGIGRHRSIEQMQSLEESGNTKRSTIGQALDHMKKSYVEEIVSVTKNN